MSSTEASVSVKNAFSLLMTKKNGSNNESLLQRRSSFGTEFIDCPVGCGKRMLEKDINLHLDQCIGLQQQDDNMISKKVEDSVEENSTSTSQTLNGEQDVQIEISTLSNSYYNIQETTESYQCVKRSTKAMSSSQQQETSSSQLMQQGSLKEASACNFTTPSSSADNLMTLNVANNVDNDIDLKETTVDINVDDSEVDNDLNNEVSCGLSPKAISQSPDPHSVFGKMMKQSKAIFGNKDKTKPPLHLSFHLDESLRVRLSYPMTIETEWAPPVWSVLMNLRDKYSTISDEEYPTNTETKPTNIEVTVSTDIASYMQPPTRWVRNHSQLSVPTLKSILQKSIRRRKPLPAVRVAMELADKALGPLLRRIPIIMLEDSYLHPDINFLIWLMMSYTKNYQPSPKLMIRLFQIIYEIAACQWSDPLPTSSSLERSINDSNNCNTVRLTSIFSQPTATNDNNDDEKATNNTLTSTLSSFDEPTTFVWSLLVRAEYGGMRCDLQMLYRYASLWYERGTVQKSINPVTTPLVSLMNIDKESKVEEETLHWSMVPSLVYEKPHQQGMDRVTTLCNQGLDRLQCDDICIEGIDYHCSGIVNVLLADEHLCGICYDLMTLAIEQTAQPTMTSMTDTEHRNALEQILKVVIWNFNSKINHRRQLLLSGVQSEVVIMNGSNNDTTIDYRNYTELWNDIIAPKVVQYQTNYVRQRLAR